MNGQNVTDQQMVSICMYLRSQRRLFTFLGSRCLGPRLDLRCTGTCSDSTVIKKMRVGRRRKRDRILVKIVHARLASNVAPCCCLPLRVLTGLALLF